MVSKQIKSFANQFLKSRGSTNDFLDGLFTTNGESLLEDELKHFRNGTRSQRDNILRNSIF